MAEPERPIVRTETMAAIIGLSVMQIGRLAKQGVIPGPISRGAWDVIAVVQAFVELERARADKRTERTAGMRSEELKLLTARREKVEADRDAQRMRNAEIQRQTFTRDEITGLVQDAFGRTRARLRSIPARAAATLSLMDTQAKMRAELLRMIDEALSELVETAVVSDAGGIGGRGGNGTRLVDGAEPSADADSE